MGPQPRAVQDTHNNEQNGTGQVYQRPSFAD